jgi:DNA-binding NtrC family response regulator
MPEKDATLKGARILLVDDNAANLDVLCTLLEGEDYDLALASNGDLALKIASRTRPELILLDVVMPGMDGYEVCRRLKADPNLRSIPVLFISALDRLEDVVAGFRAGGVDYVTKPFRDEEVLARVETHLRLERQNRELAAKNNALEEEIVRRKKLRGQLSMIARREAERWGLEGFVGRSATVRRIFDDVQLLRENPSTSVLIQGESGTGKELIARAIHFGSPRRESPFVPVNCASMPRELAESLLFGHVKGAFTSADADRAGYFEMAHEGTLFLDELGEMPLELQAKLLRVLEDGQIWRVGARQGHQVDVRVVAATNADLQRRIQETAFRQDLYFRIARFTVTAPPLRQRREDIPLLTRHFLQILAAEMGREAPDLSPQTLAKLQDYPFPGNVRELKNVVERALLESRGGEVQLQHLHLIGADLPAATTTPSTDELVTLEENERRHIQRVLEATGWRVRGPDGAARILGIPESTLRGRLGKLGIQRPSAR